MTIITRFAPSPTGYLHIGGARTALFNWCFARANQGKFLLRIEDTDRARSTPEAVDAILDGLKWLGLDWDDEPTYQFKNVPRHRAIAEELIRLGKAYYCYCTPDELEKMRVEGHGYDRRWRDRDPSDAPVGVPPVIRIKAPLEGDMTIIDAVQGEVRVNTKQLDDFILLRADGTPTYMLAVVVDDHDMGITHVIRGDDHLNNSFRQKIIIDGMGWSAPTYAHIPLIHGDDGAKLSKRHGALSVTEYDEMGYLPDAIANYLMRLGWGHGNDEIFSRDQAIEWFTLEGINKAPSRLDFKKLNDVNAHYIHNSNNDTLIDLILRRHKGAISDQQKSWLLAGIEEIKLRTSTLNELVYECGIYLNPLPFTYEEKASDLIKDGNATLQALHDSFAVLPVFDAETIEAATKNIASALHEGKFGKVGMPLRAALTGRTHSPSVNAVAAILGREETLLRLKAAIDLS